jgi:hypothetical protein
MSPRDASRLGPGEWAVFWTVSIANLVPLWAFRYFPGQDTPNHLYAVEVTRALLDGTAEPALSAAFAPALAAKSNVLFHGVMLALARAGLSVDVAHRLVLSGYALALPLAGVGCARAAGGAAPLALLLLPLVWSWFALQGLYNYVLSLPPALVWLGIVARHGARPRGRAAAALAAAAVLVYLAHAGTFVALVAVTALRVAFPGDGAGIRARVRLAAARPLALALAPALGLALVGLVRGAVAGGGAPPEPTVSRWEAYGPLEAAGAFVVEFAMRFHLSDLAILGPPLAVLIAVPIAAARRREPGVAPRWPFVAALVLIALYFVLPHIVLGSDASPRLRPLVVFCLLCATGFSLSPRARRRVAALALCSGLAGAAVLARDCDRLGRGLDDFTSGVAAVPRGSRLYPMVFDPRGPSLLVRPFLHAWAYYGVARHVVTPFAFAWHETRFPYRYRELPLHLAGSAVPSDAEDEPYAIADGRLCRAVRRLAPSESCAVVRRDAEARLADLGAGYDVVLTWAAPPDFTALLAARGFRPLHARGLLALYAPPAAGRRS